jgi:hypothetical protein
MTLAIFRTMESFMCCWKIDKGKSEVQLTSHGPHLSVGSINCCVGCAPFLAHLSASPTPFSPHLTAMWDPSISGRSLYSQILVAGPCSALHDSRPLCHNKLAALTDPLRLSIYLATRSIGG